MSPWLSERIEVARQIFDRPWVKWTLIFWGAVGVYDLVVSQFVPEPVARRFPKMHELITAVADWLSWWVWLSVFAGIVAAACFEYAFRKSRELKKAKVRVQAPHGGASELMRDFQEGKWEIKYPPLRTPIPDWPIDELFSHIEPRILEDDGAHWDVTGHKIRDSLSLGRLKAWGRPVEDSGLGALLGERAALREIAANYWHSAHFTYHFFDSTADDAPHTYVDQGRNEPAYTDLQVNRAQALAIWPERTVSDSLPSDLAEHIPNLRVADRLFARNLFERPHADRLIPLLEAEKVSAWGRRMGGGEPPPTKIPGSIWNAHVLHILVGRDQWARNQTFLKSKSRGETIYYDVHLNEAQIARIWPQSRKDKVRELDDLYAEGVNRRDWVQSTKDWRYPDAKWTFDHWNERVIAVLDSFSVADKSKFRTLNRFNWEYSDRHENEPERRYLEALWNEKLKRLSAIIAESGE